MNPRKAAIDSAKGDIETEFKEQAKHSTCPSGKDGGSLGSFSAGQMVPEFDAICFDESKAVGVVHGPIKTQFGYHLILVEEREVAKKDE